MPAMGNLISLVLEVCIWLAIPVLLKIQKREVAKWSFLGISIYWLLTTVFNLLDQTGFAGAGRSALSCAIGVFVFLLAAALIAVAGFAVVNLMKKEKKWKKLSLSIYLGCLLIFVLLFALFVAYFAKWGAGWSEYFYLLYTFLALPFAMLFAAIVFWFDGNEFDKTTN